MFGCDTVTKATYQSLINRATDKLVSAEARGRARSAARWGRVVGWLEGRAAKAQSPNTGAPNRRVYTSTRIVPLEAKGFYAGQPVSHRHAGRGVVLGDDAPAGWVWVREDDDAHDSRTMWRVNETRTRKGVARSVADLAVVTG